MLAHTVPAVGTPAEGHRLAVLPRGASATMQPLQSGCTALQAAGRAGCREQPCTAVSALFMNSPQLTALHSFVKVTLCLVQLCSPAANSPSINKNYRFSYPVVHGAPPVQQDIQMPSGSEDATPLNHTCVMQSFYCGWGKTQIHSTFLFTSNYIDLLHL